MELRFVSFTVHSYVLRQAAEYSPFCLRDLAANYTRHVLLVFVEGKITRLQLYEQKVIEIRSAMPLCENIRKQHDVVECAGFAAGNSFGLQHGRYLAFDCFHVH